MVIKKGKLFYTRYLQQKFYFTENKFVSAIFYLEDFLFKNHDFEKEVLISNLKYKWIYDKIENDDYSNEITKNFRIFQDKKIKSEILNLIEMFSEVGSFKEESKFFDSLKKFNKKFNEILNLSRKNNFQTSLIFQYIFLIYIKKHEISENIKKKINFSNQSIDLFESVFIGIFLKNNVFKVSKSYYLIKLLVKFLIK